MRNHSLRLLAVAAAGLFVLAGAREARASSQYPGIVNQHLSLSYTPACSLCHQNGVTGTGTVTTPFGLSLRDRGLVAGNDASLTAALDKNAADNVDSDGDGVSDIEELVAGTNPNGTSGGGSLAAPDLAYGCGATVAPAGPAPRSAVPFALGLALAAAALRRRRVATAAAAIVALSAAGCYEVSFVSSDVCSSGLEWTGGDSGSPTMNPGLACIDCHTSGGDGPHFTFAGTVYTKSNEADTCVGTQDAYIIVTGSDGKNIRLDPNEAGNFYSSLKIGLPYTAMLVQGDKKNVMTTPQTSGDCNSCHTPAGKSGAPGRITPP